MLILVMYLAKVPKGWLLEVGVVTPRKDATAHDSGVGRAGLNLT